ncbi:MAG: acyl--CoA ligase [Oscillospiraceae bacterium]|nr:acyl--CoA ligase [Oscillospiraceae bacterium]
MSRIIEAFHTACAQEKNKPSFYYLEKGKRRTKTFHELWEDTDAMVQYLYGSGVRKGDRILAFAAPCYQLCVFMLASLTLGASIMYVDIWAKQDRLKNAFTDYRPDYVLVSDQTVLIKVFFREIRRIKNVINIDSVRVKDYEPAPVEEISEDAVALLTMTTGSTGTPKIAIRTHRNLFEQLKLINENMEFQTKDEIVLTTSYIYVFANIMKGYTTVLPQINLALQSRSQLSRKLAKFIDIPVSMIITSPDFCLKTNNLYPELKRVFFGGAILNIREAKTIQSKFGNAEIVYIYGATECNLIASTHLTEYINLLKKEQRCALGKAVQGVQVKIGKNNEILVSSRALLENYLIQDKSNKTMEDHTVWHNTGDTGVYENGILYYLGRSKYRLNVESGSIYSNQIEQNVILQFKAIQKCAVLQKDDMVYLFVEISETLDFSEIAVFLRERYHIRNIQIRRLKRIPCDVKHHTKINYQKLMERII